jgi:hypothetical protein
LVTAQEPTAERPKSEVKRGDNEKAALHNSTEKCRTERENTQQSVENPWKSFCRRSLKIERSKVQGCDLKLWRLPAFVSVATVMISL